MLTFLSCDNQSAFNGQIPLWVMTLERVLVLESWHKGTKASCLSRPVMDEEGMRLGCYMWSML